MKKNALYVRDRNRGLGVAPFSEFEFEPDSAQLQGSTASLHGVAFGKLHTYDDVMNVAVKPFDNGRAIALREHTAYEFMGKAGFESFKPLGIVASEGKAFLLTEYEASLKTFDNLRWSPIALELGDIGDEQVELLKEAAGQLGRMHAMGITHGDAQPKNVALSESGRVGFIDLESMQYDPEGLGTETMSLKMVDDLLSFYGKLRSWYGYCSQEEAKTRFKQFDDQFLQKYAETYKSTSRVDIPVNMRRLLCGLRVNVIKYILTEGNIPEVKAK